MRRWFASSLSATLFIFTARAAAQPGHPDGTTARAPQFERGMDFTPRADTDQVAFSLEEADLTELVRTIGEVTGKRFIVAAKGAKGFKGTIYSPQKISVGEAYQAFLSLLAANNMTVVPAGRHYKIVDTLEIARSAPLEATAEERYVTRVHRLSYVSADEASTVLGNFKSKDGSVVTYGPRNLLIITDTGPNIRRMTRLLEDIDVPSGRDGIYVQPIFHKSAVEIEKRLSEIVDYKAAAGQGSSPQGASSHIGELHVAKVVPIDRPNALVIVATQTSYQRLLKIIQELDVVSESDVQMHIVHLQYADAKTVRPALTDAVMGASSAASGQAQAQQGRAPTSVFEAPIKISSEDTSNSLIVSATPRDYAAVLEVIHGLDLPRRQVYIEAVVMDISLNHNTTINPAYHGIGPLGQNGSFGYSGFDPALSIAAPLGAGTTALQSFVLGVQGPSFNLLGQTIPATAAFLSAVSVNTDADILSTPTVIATDNMPAELKVQVTQAFQTNVSPVSISAGATATANPLAALSSLTTPNPGSNQIQVGPRIKVTPHLNDSDQVRLDIDESNLRHQQSLPGRHAGNPALYRALRDDHAHRARRRDRRHRGARTQQPHAHRHEGPHPRRHPAHRPPLSVQRRHRRQGEPGARAHAVHHPGSERSAAHLRAEDGGPRGFSRSQRALRGQGLRGPEGLFTLPRDAW